MKMPRVERISDLMREREEKQQSGTEQKQSTSAAKDGGSRESVVASESEAGIGKEAPRTDSGKDVAGASGGTDSTGEMEETLLCAICCEIIHDCIRFVLTVVAVNVFYSLAAETNHLVLIEPCHRS